MQTNMEYEMEELLPILVKLTQKYTSNESSSVSYEIATMLMEAILYSIEECYNASNIVLTQNKLEPETAYKIGADMVVDKVCKSKELYDELIKDFEDYGCENYKDTILNGMPEFYLKYDAKFCPQDHLLTLDYPSLKTYKDLKGVDRIYRYLSDIKMEQKFLNNFRKEAIENLLERITPNYKEDYFENICYPVLLTSIGCVIADKPIYLLKLEEEDINKIEAYFIKDTLEKIQQKIHNILHIILSRTSDKDTESYFFMLSNEYGVRVKNSLSYHSLNSIFYISY